MNIIDLMKVEKLPVLEGNRKAKIIAYEPVENEKGGYLQLTLELKDREYKTNIFPKQLDYLLGCLRRQLGKSTEKVALLTLIEEMIKEKSTFEVNFSWNEQYGSQIAFMPKIAKQASDIINA